jgi:hypothetical protein
VIGAPLQCDRYGLGAQMLLALAVGVLTQVLARLVIALRRRAKAA